jgi:hypothetical protein
MAMTDQSVRDAALDIERHLLLQAPAGSGKTTVLAQRFLAALASVDEPEQVLAITFTRKAAAEMRERVLLALEGALPASQPDGELWARLRAAVLLQAQRRGWALEELPTRLRIQTIDALCHEIARAMPLLGRMHQQLEVVDDATPAMLEAAAETLRLADADHPLQADADLLLRRLDNDWERARGLLAAMLPTRNRWLPVLLETPPDQLGARVAASLVRIARETLQGLHDEMDADLRREAAELARLSAGHRHAAGDVDAGLWRSWLEPCDALAVDSELLSFWQAVVALALKSDGEWRAVVNVKHGFPPAERMLKQRWKAWLESLQSRPAALARLRAVAALPPPLLDEEEAGALAALSRLLVLAAAVLKLEFRQRGQVDHGEVAAVARQALREMDTPTELSIRQTLRVRHLLSCCARCSWWAIPCSPSTCSAIRKWACSCARVRKAWAASVCRRCSWGAISARCRRWWSGPTRRSRGYSRPPRIFAARRSVSLPPIRRARRNLPRARRAASLLCRCGHRRSPPRSRRRGRSPRKSRGCAPPTPSGAWPCWCRRARWRPPSWARWPGRVCRRWAWIWRRWPSARWCASSSRWGRRCCMPPTARHGWPCCMPRCAG